MPEVRGTRALNPTGTRLASGHDARGDRVPYRRSRADAAAAREAELAVAAVRAQIREGGPGMKARLAAIWQQARYAEGGES